MTIWKDKFRAAGIHLSVSLAVAALAAWLVFGLWYPYPYREISGGRELFMLVTAVDVVLGPLMTLVVYNRTKSRREKLLDFSVIGALQIAALCYGLWTVAQSRPVHMVFGYDRFPGRTRCRHRARQLGARAARIAHLAVDRADADFAAAAGGPREVRRRHGGTGWRAGGGAP